MTIKRTQRIRTSGSKPKPDTIVVDATLADAAVARHRPHNGKVKTIKTDTQYTNAVQLLREVKHHQKALELDREQIIKPIRSGLDRLYDKFKQATDYLKSQESAIKGILEAYAYKKQINAIVSAKKKAAKVDNQELAADIVSDAASREAVPDLHGMSYRTTWVFNVEDESKVPIEHNGFLLRPIDPKILRKMTIALKERASCPGVVFKAEKKATIKVG